MNIPNTQPAASGSPVLGEAALWIILRMPLLPVAAGFCAGIVGDRCLPWPYWVHILAFLLAGAGLWQAYRAREHRASIWAIAAIFVAAAAGGGLRHQVAFWRVEPTHVALYVQQPGMLARLRGTILSEPVIRRPQANPYGLASLQHERTRFLLDCEAILTTAGWAPCTGLVRTSVQEPAADLRTHDRVETFAALRLVDPPSNRGEYDWQLHQRRSGIYVGASVAQSEAVRTLPPHAASWGSRLARLRGWGRAALLDGIDPESPEGGLLTTYVTGQRAAVSRQIDEAFRRSGTAHLLAVSGAHVGMIALGGWWVGRLVLRRPRRCALLVLGLVVLYALLLEPNAPAMRAVIASVLGVLAVLAGRPLSPGNLLAAAAITLLAISPTDLFSAGFQLSFVAVTALLAVCPMMYRLLFGPHTTAGWVVHRIRYKDWPRAVYWPLETLRLYCSTNVTAWVAVAPLVAYHFGMFNTYGPVATMLMLPLASAALFVGFAKLLLGTILPTLGGLMARPAGWLGALMARQAEALGSWPFASVSASCPSIWLVVAWYALLLAWVILVRRGQVRARSPAEQARAAGTGLSADPAVGPPTSWLHPDLRLAMPPSAPIHTHAVVLAAAALVLAYFITSAPARPPDAPRMHVLAVGDGLSVVIQGPNGRNLLYDCGSLNLPAPAETVAVPALRALGIDRIHAAFVSHPNLDHYGGIAALAKAIPVERFFTTEAFLAAAEQGAPGRLLRDLAELHVPVQTCRRGDRIEGVGPLELEVLWPPADPPAPLSSANDTSLVLRISHGQTRALLTGDIEPGAQLHLVDQAAEALRAGLLVLPHHGSPRCLLEPFLAAVRPRTAVASTGDRTRAAGIRRTGRLAAELFDTANDGMITIDLLADGPRTCPFRRRGGPPSLAGRPTPGPD